VVAVHQVLPVFAPRDAIGNHTAAIRRVLHGMGIASEIFAGDVMAGAGNRARSIRHINAARIAGQQQTIWMYHASTGSSVAEWWEAAPGHKAIDYHNIAPAELIGVWEPHVGVELEHGRRQLAELAGVTEWAIADSSYNEHELVQLGYRSTSVVPILIDTEHMTSNVDQDTLRRLEARKAGAEWLFVSRLLPHKAQHDLIKAFDAYRRAYDPDARLTLVGAVGSGRYVEALNDFVEDLELADSVDITGSLPAEVLSAYFHAADVYVSASDHEGFGVGLLEAMAYQVPVVAYAAAAVPETVGGAALLIDDKAPTTLAAAVRRVVADPALATELVNAGNKRLSEVGLPVSTARLRDAVTDMVGGL
jgi:glycosyltransferase involved in cell wall biosynthesis